MFTVRRVDDSPTQTFDMTVTLPLLHLCQQAYTVGRVT